MTQWNHDISAAPRGEEKFTTITVDGKQRTKREYHVAPVWLAWADGKVTRSYWVPETKAGPARWSGFTAAQVPIAWQHFVVPAHPFAAATQGEAAAPTAPMNVSLPETDERSGEGANAGECPDEILISTTPPQISAVEPVSSSTGHLYLEDAGSGA